MTDKITTDSNSVSYPNEKPGPDARIANPSPGNQKTTADSQAGDELRQLAGLIIYGEEFAIGHDYDRGEDDIENGMKLIAAYAERRATEARIAELQHLDSLTYSFMSLGNDFDYSYRQSAVDDRISALTKEIQQ